MQSRRKSQPVEVGTPLDDLNHFVDLREQADSIDAQITSLKPRILAIVPDGKKSLTIVATRRGDSGRFVVTTVTRDHRQFNEEKTIELLKSKGLTDAIVMKPTIDQDAMAVFIEKGAISKAELRKVLTGAVSTFPKVTFKPDE